LSSVLASSLQIVARGADGEGGRLSADAERAASAALRMLTQAVGRLERAPADEQAVAGAAVSEALGGDTCHQLVAALMAVRLLKAEAATATAALPLTAHAPQTYIPLSADTLEEWAADEETAVASETVLEFRHHLDDASERTSRSWGLALVVALAETSPETVLPAVVAGLQALPDPAQVRARAGNRQFWLLSALCAHTKAPYITNLL
jgi:hypothetical protein